MKILDYKICIVGFLQKAVPLAVLVWVQPASHETMPSGNIVYELQGTNDMIHIIMSDYHYVECSVVLLIMELSQ